MEAEMQLEAEETGIGPSWGTGRQVSGTGTTMAAITRSETGTGIEPRGGSELRLSLLKICKQREREVVTEEKHNRKQKTTR